MTVTNVEDPPDAVNDTATVAEDTAANVIGVLGNDTDVDGDTLTVSAVSQGAHGSVTNGGTSVSYTPAANFFGADSFTYTVSDGHGGSDTASVSVTVTNVNDAPTAAANSYSVNQDTTLTVPAPGVLGNDSDLDGDLLAAVLAGNVSHGTLALAPAGGFVYQPNPHFAGTDGFSYKASDGTVDSNVAPVTIAVADTEPPVINAAVATELLWPPNHDLVDVGLAVTATDNASAVTTQVAVFSDEDDVASGGGEASPDAKSTATGSLRLRAERTGSSNGRVYLIIVSAHDASGNASHACRTVVVPKSASGAAVGAVLQQAQAARAQCTATGLPPAGYFVVGDGPVIGPKQ